MSQNRITLSHSPTCASARAATAAAARPDARPSGRAGCPPRSSRASSSRLRAEGATYRELAEAPGLAVGTVHRIVRGNVLVDPSTQELLVALEPSK
jgi:hypothetical protein